MLESEAHEVYDISVSWPILRRLLARVIDHHVKIARVISSFQAKECQCNTRFIQGKIDASLCFSNRPGACCKQYIFTRNNIEYIVNQETYLKAHALALQRVYCTMI